MSGLGMLFAAAAGFADGVGKYNERELQREREAAEKEAERQFQLDLLNRQFYNQLYLKEVDHAYRADLDAAEIAARKAVANYYNQGLLRQAQATADRASVNAEVARNNLRWQNSLEYNMILCDNGDEDACAAVKRLSALSGTSKGNTAVSDTSGTELRREVVKRQMEVAGQVYTDCMSMQGMDHAVCARKAQEAASAIVPPGVVPGRSERQTLSPSEFLNRIANMNVAGQGATEHQAR